MSISKADITDGMRRAMLREPAMHAPGRPIPAPVAPPATAPEAVKATTKAVGLGKPQGRKVMNRTEAAYALILEAEKRAGLWIRYGREELTLRWPDGMRYTADFMALAPENDSDPSPAVVVWMIEVKGAFIEGDALVKFRAARAYWPEFHFKMMQLKKGRWEQVL